MLGAGVGVVLSVPCIVSRQLISSLAWNWGPGSHVGSRVLSCPSFAIAMVLKREYGLPVGVSRLQSCVG